MKQQSTIKAKDIIYLDDYTIYFQIGKGGQSKVYYAKQNHNNERIALKVSNGDIFNNVFAKETDFMAKIPDSPQILKKLSSLERANIDKKQRVFYAMELADEGNLQEYILFNDAPMPEFVIKYYSKQVLDSIEKVHNMGYCHNDLKLENQLLDKDFDIKLSDFGCVTQLDSTNGSSPLSNNSSSAKCIGTEYYMSPELYQGIYPDEKNDLFALGVCQFILFYGFRPFNKATVMDAHYKHFYSRKKSEFWSLINKKSKRLIPKELSVLIDSLFECDKNKRLQLNELKSNTWIHDCNIDANVVKENVQEYMKSVRLKARKDYLQNLNVVNELIMATST